MSRKPIAAAGLVLSLSAFAPQLATATPYGSAAKTLENVTAQPGVRHVVKVKCDSAAWPTRGQVALHARASKEDAEALRRQIRTSGRAICDSGYTHALVVFKAMPGM